MAYVDRHQHTIELDPAVRVGARLDGDGEAVLLHTTARGHCGDTAHAVARLLRNNGWTVHVRTFNELDALPRSAVGLTASDAVLGTIGVEAEQPISNGADLEPAPIVQRSRSRRRCRVCGHITIGRGVRSHVANLAHNDWETVRVSVDGTVTPVQTQA